MPNKVKDPPSREAICAVLAEKLDDALLAKLFPGHELQALRQILAPSASGKTADASAATRVPQAVQGEWPAQGMPGWCRLFTDGASRGNPGHAGAGAVLFNEDDRELGRLSSYLGICTNNVAEYRALLAGLEEAQRCGCSRVALFLDSELVVRQLQGRYKVKHEQLQPLYQRACALLAGLAGWSVTHVPRADNAIADLLANEGIDSHLAQEKTNGHTDNQDAPMRAPKQAALFSD